MENIAHIVEWMGVLLLSIEAIKLENLKKLIATLPKIRIAINSPLFWDKESKILHRLPPADDYGVLRKYGDLITYCIGVVIMATLLISTNLLSDAFHFLERYVFVFAGISVFRVLLNAFTVLVLLLAVPFYLGNEFVRVFTIVADRSFRLMDILERNTYNGIIGIFGFLLITVSTIINLAIR